MDKVETVMSDFYHTLLELRYPDITKAESKDVACTILTGVNRISLLTWLLTQKCLSLSMSLAKLESKALENELLKYYSELGICCNKDILLGNCSMEEQLPTLQLLLDFMKKVHLEPVSDTSLATESVADILKMYVGEDICTIPSLSNTTPKLNYSEARKYFEDLKNTPYEPQTANEEATSNMIEEPSLSKDETYEEQNALFAAQTQKFIEAFQSVSSWPTSNVPSVEKDLPCMDTEIKKICLDFSVLKKTLEIKDKIHKTVIPNGLPKTSTPLDSVVEDIVISIEGISK